METEEGMSRAVLQRDQSEILTRESLLKGKVQYTWPP
jgi:hypothetical protein